MNYRAPIKLKGNMSLRPCLVVDRGWPTHIIIVVDPYTNKDKGHDVGAAFQNLKVFCFVISCHGFVSKHVIKMSTESTSKL